MVLSQKNHRKVLNHASEIILELDYVLYYIQPDYPLVPVVRPYDPGQEDSPVEDLSFSMEDTFSTIVLHKLIHIYGFDGTSIIRIFVKLRAN